MLRAPVTGAAAHITVRRHRLAGDAHLANCGHEQPRLWVVAQGVLRVSTAAEVALLHPSCARWIAAHSPYELATYGDVDAYLVEMSPILLEHRVLRPETVFVTPLLWELVSYAPQLAAQDLLKQRRVGELLLDLVEACETGLAALKMPRSTEALALARCLLQPTSFAAELPSLAQPLGVRTLQRRFPQETGLTIEAWRQSARIHHAIGRLAAGSSVAGAAEDAGYANVATFISAFRRETGLTPGRFLRRWLSPVL